MQEDTKIQGCLVSLHWPKGNADATLAVDLTKLQQAKAEIEDASGVTHRIEVCVCWDADYLVGKEVVARSSDEGVLLSEI
jgi:hypothetical protein